MKNILRKAKNKYKLLERNISLDSLCGNRFWKNEITVNKYLAGMIILKNMRNLAQEFVIDCERDAGADKKNGGGD
jgi:hypothetical protein